MATDSTTSAVSKGQAWLDEAKAQDPFGLFLWIYENPTPARLVVEAHPLHQPRTDAEVLAYAENKRCSRISMAVHETVHILGKDEVLQFGFVQAEGQFAGQHGMLRGKAEGFAFDATRQHWSEMVLVRDSDGNLYTIPVQAIFNVIPDHSVLRP